jgi:hypothetical protein
MHTTQDTLDWRLIDTTTTHNKFRVDAYYLTFANESYLFVKTQLKRYERFHCTIRHQSKLMDDRLAEIISTEHTFAINWPFVSTGKY